MRLFNRFSILFFLFLGIVFNLNGQKIYPPENKAMNSRILHLDAGEKVKKGNYFFLIWEKGDSSTIKTIKSNSGKVKIPFLLDFGKSYEWQFLNKKQLSESQKYPIHNFSVLYNQRIDTNFFRHRVVQRKPGYKMPGAFMLDFVGVAVNDEGEAIWIVPDTTLHHFKNLQAYKDGTVAYYTSLNGGNSRNNLLFRHISRDGQLLWEAPDDGRVSENTIENYHHDYIITSDSTYMLVGNTYLLAPVPGQTDKTYRIDCGSIIEYDKNKNIVWSWKSADYLKIVDLQFGGPNPNPSHLNGIWLDEKRSLMLVSFRFINRIILLDKKSGKVLDSWGSKYPSGEARTGDSLFIGQHSPKFLNDSTMILYNNGAGKGKDSVSSVAIYHIPLNTSDSIRLIWKKNLWFGNQRESFSLTKGDVDILPDGNYLANMGDVPRTLVISPEGEILLEIRHEMKTPGNPWMWINENYRVGWFDPSWW